MRNALRFGECWVCILIAATAHSHISQRRFRQGGVPFTPGSIDLMALIRYQPAKRPSACVTAARNRINCNS